MKNKILNAEWCSQKLKLKKQRFKRINYLKSCSGLSCSLVSDLLQLHRYMVHLKPLSWNFQEEYYRVSCHLPGNLHSPGSNPHLLHPELAGDSSPAPLPTPSYFPSPLLLIFFSFITITNNKRSYWLLLPHMLFTHIQRILIKFCLSA